MNEEWVSQIKRGTLEYVLMLLILQKDRYGYDLIQILNAYPMLKTKESTIYPLLRRLLKNGYLESYWQHVDEGTPARKYYRITPAGTLYVNQLDSDWNVLTQSISKLKTSNANSQGWSQ